MFVCLFIFVCFCLCLFCIALSINEESSNHHMMLHYKVLCPKHEFCFGLTEDHNGETELPKSSQGDTHRLSILLGGGTISVITKGAEASWHALNSAVLCCVGVSESCCFLLFVAVVYLFVLTGFVFQKLSWGKIH